nr:NB-ARC domains-containing protein [Tanacetum cinerariifolium]
MAASSTPHRWSYDVFVSFRGDDIRKGFMDHLFENFKQKGIHAFRDDSDLPRGEKISPQLDKAIKESRFLFVVFSKHYASSSWCLRELVKILERKEIGNSKQEVQIIFYDVKPDVVRKQTGSYAEAFAKHKVSNRREVDTWRKALSMASDLSGWDLQDMTNGFESKFINIISKEILKKLCNGPLDSGENLVGVGAHVDKLDLGRFIGSRKVHMIGICTTRKRETGDGIFSGDICPREKSAKRQKWVLRGANSRRLFQSKNPDVFPGDMSPEIIHLNSNIKFHKEGLETARMLRRLTRHKDKFSRNGKLDKKSENPVNVGKKWPSKYKLLNCLDESKIKDVASLPYATERMHSHRFGASISIVSVPFSFKKQKVVSLSSAEAEFRGIAKGLAEALWIQKLVSEIGFPPQESTQIMCDNKAAIQISENPVQHDRTKHVEVDRHFIKEKLEAGFIELPFVKSSDKLADILTKAVGTDMFHKCLSKLNFGNPTIQLEGGCWKRK